LGENPFPKKGGRAPLSSTLGKKKKCPGGGRAFPQNALENVGFVERRGLAKDSLKGWLKRKESRGGCSE